MSFSSNVNRSQMRGYSTSSNIGSRFSGVSKSSISAANGSSRSMHSSVSTQTSHNVAPATKTPDTTTFNPSVLNHQLHPLDKSQCAKTVNSSPAYNNQLQCGVPNAMTGLITENPAATKCVLDLQQAKRNAAATCNPPVRK